MSSSSQSRQRPLGKENFCAKTLKPGAISNGGTTLRRLSARQIPSISNPTGTFAAWCAGLKRTTKKVGLMPDLAEEDGSATTSLAWPNQANIRMGAWDPTAATTLRF